MGKIVDSSWYRYDFSQDSEHLIVGFGSIRMFVDRQNNKGWEWDNTFKYKFSNCKFNRMFIGDLNNSWWHTGYEGLPSYGPYALRDFLLEKIKESGATKTLYLGVSMGAYGAILFGCLTGATKVMAFSPQTYLTKHRWRKSELHRKFEGYEIDTSLTDLKIVLEEKNNYKTIYKIWYGEYNKPDDKAIKRISNIENVFINTVKSKRHNIAPIVIKSGIFKEEIYEFLGVHL